jgi:hypothetical protein
MTLRPVEAELYRCFYVAENDSGSYDPRRFVAWDFIRDAYRVLYTAGSEFTALVEVLCALRPSKKTVEAIAAIEDPDEAPPEEPMRYARDVALRAANERLKPRYIACLLTRGAPFVFDVLHGASRSALEAAFGLDAGSLKTGDFATRNLAFTRNVSRYVFEKTGAVGVYSVSAEDGDGYVTAFFEDDRLNGKLRIGEALMVEGTRRALTADSLRAALAYLNILSALPDDVAQKLESMQEPKT